ncbi:unnamed protein product, partial [Musa textilis]
HYVGVVAAPHRLMWTVGNRLAYSVVVGWRSPPVPLCNSLRRGGGPPVLCYPGGGQPPRAGS